VVNAELKLERRALKECRQDLSAGRAFHLNFAAGRLGFFLREVSYKHGEERVRMLLAATVNAHSTHSQYAGVVVNWAQRVLASSPTPPIPDIVLDEHPVYVAEAVRALMKREKEETRADRSDR